MIIRQHDLNKKEVVITSFFYRSGWADLNRRPPRPKRGALPTALHPGG